MDNVTYIFPVLELGSEQHKKRILDTLNSMKSLFEPDNDSAIIVGPKDVIENIDKELGINVPKNGFITELISEGKDVYSLVNDAVMECTTEYFSVLEPGEVYSSNWRKNAAAYGKGCSVIVPLVNNIAETADGKMDEGAFLSNELAWAVSYNEDNAIGVINMDFLDKFMDVSLSGAFFNTEDFISIGKFKPSLKIVTWYEFLLRCAYKSKRIYVAPKIGVTRVYTPSESNISKEEADWLIKTARQEYFFNEDREKKYEGE